MFWLDTIPLFAYVCASGWGFYRYFSWGLLLMSCRPRGCGNSVRGLLLMGCREWGRARGCGVGNEFNVAFQRQIINNPTIRVRLGSLVPRPGLSEIDRLAIFAWPMIASN